MKRMLGCGIVAVVLVVVLGGLLFWGIGVNNRLVRNQVAVDAAWSQVENVYQRRADLIPNLVETVKGASNFEKSTLQAVIDARAKATQMVVSPEVLNDPAKFRQFQQVQGELSSALSRLMAVAEAYPDLKANRNYLELQSQLEGTENRIAQERMRFNTTVQTYNTAIRVFPASIVASVRGFKPKEFFQADAGAERAPEVKF
ncbi:MAG TPA: LemA family protein [Candidatus Polarisedimenticolaceae bacterium]|nr:LemA family protein [Candidatus Polarisedimenticolaceae bacterium]